MSEGAPDPLRAGQAPAPRLSSPSPPAGAAATSISLPAAWSSSLFPPVQCSPDVGLPLASPETVALLMSFHPPATNLRSRAKKTAAAAAAALGSISDATMESDLDTVPTGTSVSPAPTAASAASPVSIATEPAAADEAMRRYFTTPSVDTRAASAFSVLLASIHLNAPGLIMSSLEGLVSNKPHSLELQVRLSHRESDLGLDLRCSLAVKISARHMEKRTNTYTRISQVWTRAKVIEPTEKEPQVKIVRAPTHKVEGTPAAAVGVKPASESPGRSKTCVGPSGNHPFGLSSVFSRSSRTCPPPSWKAASRETKVAFEARKDRTIGHTAICMKQPLLVQIPPKSDIATMLEALVQNVFVSYVPVPQADGRQGILEHVQTKGGGCDSRPAQKYVLMQSGFGYALQLPPMPEAYKLEFVSLKLRSWEWEVAPLKLLSAKASLPAYPIPPQRARGGSVGPDQQVSGASPSPSKPKSNLNPRSPAPKRQRSQKKEPKAGEATCTTSEVHDRPLRLPMRHGRSLSALLDAVAETSPTPVKPLAARESRSRAAKATVATELGLKAPTELNNAVKATPVVDDAESPPMSLPAVLLASPRKKKQRTRPPEGASSKKSSRKSKAKVKEAPMGATSTAAPPLHIGMTHAESYVPSMDSSLTHLAGFSTFPPPPMRTGSDSFLTDSVTLPLLGSFPPSTTPPFEAQQGSSQPLVQSPNMAPMMGFGPMDTSYGSSSFFLGGGHASASAGGRVEMFPACLAGGGEDSRSLTAAAASWSVAMSPPRQEVSLPVVASHAGAILTPMMDTSHLAVTIPTTPHSLLADTPPIELRSASPHGGNVLSVPVLMSGSASPARLDSMSPMRAHMHRAHMLVESDTTPVPREDGMQILSPSPPAPYTP